MKVAFQGELGAFSQEAMRQLAGARAKPEPRASDLDQVFAALRSGEVDAAALPIENTLAGSVHENYDLLLKFDFEITAGNQREDRTLIPDRAAGYQVRVGPEVVFASGGTQSVSGFFHTVQAHRAGSLLRHGRQREDGDGRTARRARRADCIGNRGALCNGGWGFSSEKLKTTGKISRAFSCWSRPARSRATAGRRAEGRGKRRSCLRRTTGRDPCIGR